MNINKKQLYHEKIYISFCVSMRKCDGMGN